MDDFSRLDRIKNKWPPEKCKLSPSKKELEEILMEGNQEFLDRLKKIELPTKELKPC